MTAPGRTTVTDRAAPDTTVELVSEPVLADGPAIARLEAAISWVLRVGVVLSVAIMVAGMTMIFLSHPSYGHLTGGPSYHTVIGPAVTWPHTAGQLVHSVAAGQGEGVVMVGLFVLLLTPVVRVAVGVVGFALDRDWPMASVTAIVFTLLVASFFIGAALR